MESAAKRQVCVIFLKQILKGNTFIDQKMENNKTNKKSL